jgi:repressor of nif and glnA expression
VRFELVIDGFTIKIKLIRYRIAKMEERTLESSNQYIGKKIIEEK